MMDSKTILIWLLLLLVVPSAKGHDNEKHKKQADTASTLQVPPPSPTANEFGMDDQQLPPLNEFATFHPLVVHIPIVFLLLAALMQWVSLFLFKRELTWTAWVILLIGFIGAYAASTWFHAHTVALPPSVQKLLEEHEAYASYTQWASGIALLVQSANLFLLKQLKWVNLLVAVLITVAGACVMWAGHHGAELVHKYGIGARGYMLEQHHH